MSKKIFIHVDMNAFFASIEQRDFPELLGMPVAVTNGNHGSCIITSSYEARAFVIKKKEIYLHSYRKHIG